MPRDRAGELTILTKEEPVSEVALEVLEGGVAHEVAVLTVLEGAEGPAGTIEGVVVHGDNVHDEGGMKPQTGNHWSIYTTLSDETTANM
jgi:hypothetical protein